VLARIDLTDVLINDYDDVLKMLLRLSTTTLPKRTENERNDQTDHLVLETTDSQSEVSSASHVGDDRPIDYTLTFVEMSSVDLGKYETIDLLATGVALTFIDDFKGRDMPLWRGRAEGIEVRVDRGIGVGTQLIQSSADGLLLPNSTLVSDEWLAGSIRNVALGQVDIEYYHATVAVWEPLLEPSQLCIIVERRDATTSRTQQVAISLTNDVSAVRVHNFMPSREAAGGVVSVAVSDAGAEVMARSIAEFSAWQSRDLARINDSEDSEDLPSADERQKALTSSAPRAYRGHGGAQKAAQAALDYAKKRGVSTRKQNEAAKPFILRNRSGLTLWFCEEESSRLQARSDRIESGHVLHGSDYRFSMEMVTSETNTINSRQRRKKVRRYDGQFPRLSVSFEATNVSVIEPLRELPVSKVGTFLRYLVEHLMDRSKFKFQCCGRLMWLTIVEFSQSAARL